MPGFKRPFDFVGVLDENEWGKVERLLNSSAEAGGGLLAIGHYPLAYIVAPRSLKALLASKGAVSYLSGHFHNGYLWRGVPGEMYTKHPEGVTELELGDWKDNRLFRVGAVDRGRLSFVDRTFAGGRNATAVLITNPLDARFVYSPDITGSFQMMKVISSADQTSTHRKKSAKVTI